MTMDETKIKRGVCPECRTFVGISKLLTARDRPMCAECGAAQIRTWNDIVTNANKGEHHHGHEETR